MFAGWLKIVMMPRSGIVGNAVIAGVLMRTCGLTLGSMRVIGVFVRNRSSGKTCVVNI